MDISKEDFCKKDSLLPERQRGDYFNRFLNPVIAGHLGL